MFKIIGGDGKEYGPIPAETLREWLRQGRVNGATQVQAEGTNGWGELRAVPEFQADLAAERPPLPRPTPAAPTSNFTETTSNAPRSGLATTSLVLGVLGFVTFGVTSLIGLIVGIIAMVRISGSQGRLGGKGLATAGIVTSGVGLVFVPIIAILAGLLLPALAQAKGKAQQINCMNNLKSMSVGLRLYAGDNGDKLPYATNWCDAIINEVGSPRVYQCPAHDGARCSYAYNAAVSGLELDDVDPRTVVLFESNRGWNGAGGAEAAAKRHPRGVAVAYADGSVETVPVGRLPDLRWNP
jgi:prepilin-type processing-associated H-X9-DG protein